MLEFLGLPWDDRVLEFHKTERVVITASKWQVRQKIHTGSAGRWQHYEKHLGPLAGAAAAAGRLADARRAQARLIQRVAHPGRIA